MSSTRTRTRKTDYGTVILHWCLVGSLAIAIITGLRIGAETPDRTWINALDAVIPRTPVWTWHMKAGVALIAVAAAYAIYMPLAGLGRRVRFDRVRATGLIGGRQARWGAINVALYWVFYALLLSQIVTGCLHYFGVAHSAAVAFHWFGTWALIGYVGLHILVQWGLGGFAQLLRIFRPARLAPPPPPFDPVELLALLDAQAERPPAAQPSTVQPVSAEFGQPSAPAARAQAVDARLRTIAEIHAFSRELQVATFQKSPAELPAVAEPQRSAGRRALRVQANPFVVATASVVVGLGFLLALEPETSDTLHVRRISAAEIPVIDGETSDRVWRKIQPLRVVTQHGANFDGTSETTIEIRAAHDGVTGYFLFVWDDPTRSLKQLPLVKEADGWRVIHEGYEAGDERAYSEDKFSILFTKLNVILAGDRTFHAGPAPAAGKPRTLSGRGLHYTMREGLYVDVWQWRATSTAPSGFIDDGHFGPPTEPTQTQRNGKSPYKGGYALDPGTSVYMDNFETLLAQDHRKPVLPRRLPISLKATAAALGNIDLDPNHGEGDQARWYMTMEEFAPYTSERDAQIPVGTIIPGVVMAGQQSGDRADVRCGARWASGRWALEVTRSLRTRTQYDVEIGIGTFMRVAAFDHSQIAHTRHVRPIQLELE